MSGWTDPVRLAVGTLSVLPTRPPTVVDRVVAGRAMTLAPGLGLVLAVLVTVPGGALAELDRPPLLLAVLLVGALAWLTRAMHLDGLADVADGLGSGRAGEGARAVMKKSDIGPFGVAALLVALLAQVAAAATLLAQGWSGALVAGLAVVGARAVLVWLCTPAFPAASGTGLGALVAGTVRPRTAGLVLLGLALATGTVLLALAGAEGVRLPLAAAFGLAAGQLAALALARRCVRRFDGVTGDVYGACLETALTSALVVAALVA
ncbi:adenosylcobinamide-GDP ribazoletransferase [Nocardioides zeae]|uniref:Adenosylcobinamide-GDP ribazoletransferase n=1 Tax=Nocardioides imazamoxiresistens TaxID=3231893 RepID=A0ABU3PTQ7_9ACTN|nr:adenosylcobinamide-GDP ribazoletransferase [Nocardioides zeae]MDT9592606.1 adenosylcobinamide-GDP ribazoletransferase [Nocardioides zeae]